MREIIVDNFAGGGGASTGIELATGRSVDIAINHDPAAIAMHRANHPETEHHCESVWDVDPREIAAGRPVGLVWLSPDCKHFSKAKGGKPVEKGIRGLAWVAVRWAATVRPRVIMLENVEEFKTWGPLLKNGYPDPTQRGRTFNSFLNALRRQGYVVETKELRACDYGAPTIRKRLFLVARCDGRPIVWPEPTHGAPNSSEVLAGKRQPWRTAAEIIDWSIPCPSIFDKAKEIKNMYGINVKRPLAVNTERRIFQGIGKHIIEVAEAGGTPFIAPYVIKVNHQGEQFRGQTIDEPLQTVTAKNGWGIVSPTLIEIGYGEGPGQSPRAPGLHKPLGTVVSGGRKHALVAAALVKHYGGGYTGAGNSLDEPLSTVTTVDHNALVTSHLVKLRGTCKDGQPVTEPMPTITAGGLHVGEIRACLIKYYGSGKNSQALDAPLHTVTSKARFGLVTIEGTEYQIVDVGMRMLKPRELFRANGFPESYIIDVDADGNKYSEKDQVARCGNAVPPPFSAALVRANMPELCVGAGRALSLERYKPAAGQMEFSL